MLRIMTYAACFIAMRAAPVAASAVEYKLLIDGLEAGDHVLAPDSWHNLTVQVRVTGNELRSDIYGGLFQSAFNLAAEPNALEFSKSASYSYAPDGAWNGTFNPDFSMAMPGPLNALGYSVFEHTAAVSPCSFGEKVSSIGANAYSTVFEGSFQFKGGATALALNGSRDSHLVAGVRGTEVRAIFPDAILGTSLRIASEASQFDNWPIRPVPPPIAPNPILPRISAGRTPPSSASGIPNPIVSAAKIEYKLLVDGVDAADHVLAPNSLHNLTIQARVIDNALTAAIHGGLLQSSIDLKSMPGVLNFLEGEPTSYSERGDVWSSQFHPDFAMAMPGLREALGYSVFAQTGAVAPSNFPQKASSIGANEFTTIFEGGFEFTEGATALALSGSAGSHLVAGLADGKLGGVFPSDVLGATVRLVSDADLLNNWLVDPVTPRTPEPIGPTPAPTIPITPPIAEIPAPELPPVDLPTPPGFPDAPHTNPIESPTAADPVVLPTEPIDPPFVDLPAEAPPPEGGPSETQIWTIDVDPAAPGEPIRHPHFGLPSIDPIAIDPAILEPIAIDTELWSPWIDGGYIPTWLGEYERVGDWLDFDERMMIAFGGSVVDFTDILAISDLVVLNNAAYSNDGAPVVRRAAASADKLVPEPSSAALLALSLLALTARTRGRAEGEAPAEPKFGKSGSAGASPSRQQLRKTPRHPRRFPEGSSVGNGRAIPYH